MQTVFRRLLAAPALLLLIGGFPTSATAQCGGGEIQDCSGTDGTSATAPAESDPGGPQDGAPGEDSGGAGGQAGTPLGASADLALTKSASTNSVQVGDEFDYTLEVVNNGPSTAGNVVITDNLPTGVEAVSTTGCQEDPAGVPGCTIGSLAPGASATVDIRVEAVGKPGLTTNTASVTSDASDPTTSNNQSAVEVFKAIGVPTLSNRALIAMMALLALVAAIAVHRRSA